MRANSHESEMRGRDARDGNATARRRRRDLEVLADDLVHADLRLLASIVGQHNAHGVPALLALRVVLASVPATQNPGLAMCSHDG